MQPSLTTCPVCLDLKPVHSPTTSWQFKVADNLLIECTLPFTFSILEISAQRCDICSAIKNGIENMSRGVFCDKLQGLSKREGCFIVQNDHPFEVEVFGEVGNGEKSVRMQFYVKEDSVCSDVGSRSSDPKWDAFGCARNIAPLVSPKSHLPLIRSWITHCLRTHSSCGRSHHGVMPTRLLDICPRPDLSIILVKTKQMNISAGIPLYATLSHCWGELQFIKTTSSKVSSFQNGIPFNALPRTFQDAISIARELDIKYIWIDSLCIIQDSPKDWRHESGLMASVYSNSYLNIAATGSSDGSQSFLSSRNLTHNSIPIPPTSLGEVRDEVAIFVRPSLSGVHMLYSTPSKTVNGAGDGTETAEAPLLSRAWVFQERHLAPRTLHFHPSELVMECRSGLRCECSGLDFFTSNPLRNFDDLSYTSWFGVVEAFSRLRLTYPSDRLEALAGVAKEFWESQRGAYLKGVWGGDAARGLLWNVTRYNQRSPEYPATRRQGKEVAPTWSWASMVLAEGNKVFFPAGDDESFASDEQFEFLDTDPPSEQSLHFGTGPGAIWVKGSAVNAIACVGGCVDEQKHDAVLIFEIEFDDMVIITTVKAEMDVPPKITRPLEETAEDASCLLVGRSMVDKNWESNQQATYLCMLVLQPCSDIGGAWERIGVLDIREDLGIHQGLKVKKLKLI